MQTTVVSERKKISTYLNLFSVFNVCTLAYTVIILLRENITKQSIEITEMTLHFYNIRYDRFCFFVSFLSLYTYNKAIQFQSHKTKQTQFIFDKDTCWCDMKTTQFN